MASNKHPKRPKHFAITLNRGNRRILYQSIVAFLFIALALYFIKHEQDEVMEVKQILTHASLRYIFIGIGLALFYIYIQGLMYLFSFRAVGEHITAGSAIKLFIKRNFISIFLPAGGISSLAFFTKDIEQQQVSTSKIHVASFIYALIGILSVLIVAIPALAYAFLENSLSSKVVYIFIALVVLVALCIHLGQSLMKEGWVYRLAIRISPSIEFQFAELKAMAFSQRNFLITLLLSILIELIGIAHLLIAMRALGYPLSIEGAVLGYIFSVMFMIISPFLRGLGAIELSLAFILSNYGFSTPQAVSITFLYRFFEFWFLLLIGAASFIFVRNNILLRIAPVFLTFILGIVNIFSVLTPAIQDRLTILQHFLPVYATEISNYAVFMVGIFLLILSVFLLRGVRMAWYLTFGLVIISMVGHLTKAIDYEEASLALFTVVALALTRKQYFVRNNPKFMYLGIQTGLMSMGAIIVYGTIGFYFLDKTHFNLDFNLWQSIKYTLQNFFFYQSDTLIPNGTFARNFLYSINISGGITLLFILYTLVRPLFHKQQPDNEAWQHALMLTKAYGHSTLDYFKTYFDKQLFFDHTKEAFIAYRTAGNYAVVLEDPVCASPQKMKTAIREFDDFCTANGLKSLFYRVSTTSLPQYKQLNKKALLIGQEAILDLGTFTIEGKNKKSIRTASNKQKALGYVAKLYQPPIKDGLLQKLHAVSNEWQREHHYDELVLSQGIFDPNELKQQPIMVIENQEEKVLAFANIIPDFAPGEATYDLIRNAKDTPNGMIEFLMAELFFYLKSQGYQTVNMGFSALAGIEEGHSLPEKSIRFAYEKLKTFEHYKGLKEFKDKFGPRWQNKYLIYTNDYDLFSIPFALKKAIQP